MFLLWAKHTHPPVFPEHVNIFNSPWVCCFWCICVRSAHPETLLERTMEIIQHFKFLLITKFILKSWLSNILCSASDPSEYSICLSRHCPEAKTYFEGQTQIVHILSFCNVKESSFRSLVIDLFHV